MIKTDYDDRSFITRLLYNDWLSIFNSFSSIFPDILHCISCVLTTFLLTKDDDADEIFYSYLLPAVRGDKWACLSQ